MSSVIALVAVLVTSVPVWAERATLDQYCVPCHNSRTKTAGLALDTIDVTEVHSNIDTWEKVVKRLRARTMPPVGAPRPDERAYALVLTALESSLDQAASATPRPGRTDTFRRLSRAEYQHAIRDLLGLDADVTTLLPKDDVSYGFDNMGGRTLSPTEVEQYLSAAQKISRLALGAALPSPASQVVVLPADLTQEDHVEGLGLGTRGGTLVRHTFPRDGEYEIEIRLSRDRNENVEGLTEPASIELSLDGVRVDVFTGRLDAVRTLVGAGAPVDEALPARRGRGGTRADGDPAVTAAETWLTAFLLAAGNAHHELASWLLDRGANPNAAPQGWTALHQVSWVRKAGISGSNDPAPEGSGRMSSLEFVRTLVTKGADVNARVTRRPPAGITSLDMIGGTPFLLAARTADFELMCLVAELGADPRAPNADGTSPLMVAAGVGTSSPGEDPGTEPEVLEAVKVALELGDDINAVDGNGGTAMHGAAYKHVPLVARFLVASGARVDVWNRPNKGPARAGHHVRAPIVAYERRSSSVPPFLRVNPFPP